MSWWGGKSVQSVWPWALGGSADYMYSWEYLGAGSLCLKQIKPIVTHSKAVPSALTI